ncbi:MAG: mobilization protein [Candidatus Tectomicrobia bacterium]|nr:mobilization protein [Candidatus Tectomicrobia bacterium]
MPNPKPITAAEPVAAIAGTHGCSQAEARQKAIRARVAKKERTRDTRRKVLVGSLLLHRMENDPENGPRFRLWLKKELPGFLRETDRNLFDDILGEGNNTEG